MLSNLAAFVVAKFFRQNNLRLQFSLIKWFNNYMTGTTILTTTLPLALVSLPSGNTAAVVYSASFGEIIIAFLLLTLVILHILQMWRSYR